LRHALSELLASTASALTVVDGAGVAVGTLSLDDIVRAARIRPNGA